MTKRIDPPLFDPQTYSTLTLSDLLIYSTYYLHNQSTGTSSEDIIAACFTLFPKRFGLRKYPHWPDAGIVSRRWSECKRKGYLRGNAVSGFQITARGVKRAEKVEKLLGKPLKPVRAQKPKMEKTLVASVAETPSETVHPEMKAHARKYVRLIESSDAYKHYTRKQPLNEFDFRSLLLCTMESPPSTLARNLGNFKEYVNIHNRKDLSSFLDYCGEKFSHMLGTTKR